MPTTIEYARARTNAFKLTIPDDGIAIGRLTGLVGRSGGGKSTFAKALAGPWTGMTMGHNGDVTVRRERRTFLEWLTALGDWSVPQEAMSLRRRLGADNVLAVHQDPSDGYLPLRSVKGHGKLIEKLCGKDQAADFEMHLRALDVDPARFGESFPGELSGGQQRRLALAVSLSFKPSVIVIDEALGSLDPESTEKVMDHLVGLTHSAGLRVLLASHELYTLARYTESAIVVKNGQLFSVDREGSSDADWLLRLRREFL